jgi:hypothetical protein
MNFSLHPYQCFQQTFRGDVFDAFDKVSLFAGLSSNAGGNFCWNIC